MARMVMSGSRPGSSAPCWASAAPVTTTARPPSPVSTSSMACCRVSSRKKGRRSVDVALRELIELVAARVLLLEGHDLAQPLHGIDGEGAEFARRLARLAAQLVDPLAHQERAQARRRAGTAAAPRRASHWPRPGRRPRRPAPGWRRRPAPRCGRRNTRPARCRGWRAPSDRRCAGARDRPAPARRACGRRRCASRPAGGRPCRAPSTIPASAARPTRAPRWRARWPGARRARGLQRQHDQRRQHADADEGDDPQHAQREGGGELALPRQDHLHQRRPRPGTRSGPRP